MGGETFEDGVKKSFEDFTNGVEERNRSVVDYFVVVFVWNGDYIYYLSIKWKVGVAEDSIEMLSKKKD